MNENDLDQIEAELENAYKNGHCYDCGELNCGGINSLTGEKDH